MNVDLTAGIVRILKPDGTTAGAGFVVHEDGLIATCSHVVQGVESQRRGDPRPAGVDLVFHATGERSHARVEPEWWRPADAEDVAILRLEGPLPAGLSPVPLGTATRSTGHPFRAFGYPEMGDVEGVWAGGLIQGSVRDAARRPFIQLASPEIDQGLSGGPVLDETQGLAVGMVVTTYYPDRTTKHRDTAFAIPADLLSEICPPLQLQYVPHPLTALTVEREPKLATTAPVGMEVGVRLNLHGKRYLIRERIAQKAFGTLVVRTARASDLDMGRDVGILQAEALTDAPECRAGLHRITSRARILGQVASRCEHIPAVYDVVDQDARAVWMVVEWIRGAVLDNLLPQDGPLPDASSLPQLLHWSTDVCEALSALHRRRVSHGGVGTRTVLVTGGRRGAILIDPGFVTPPGPLTAEPAPFAPATDVRDLAAAIYRVATHRTPQATSANILNPSIPPALDQVLQDALAGSVRRADLFRRDLNEVKRALRAP